MSDDVRGNGAQPENLHPLAGSLQSGTCQDLLHRDFRVDVIIAIAAAGILQHALA
ncbi:hypothetical protein ACFYE9_21660 [Rhizobium leguminosarum]|uniref:Uncharacterized protein n=1 Tax=Rhizobium leguminosarum TaxID=384 RepID=A0ACD5EYR8_RHILE|nr:hypothetical protein [Rhizobium leguminosarum]